MCLQHALRSYSLVFYAVYTPKITRLLREAEESGATIVSGLEMFIGQAYEQFERFTGLSGELSSYYTLYIYIYLWHALITSSVLFWFIQIYLNPPFLLAAPEELFKKIMSKN
jgi:3-dehydroquinate dehydratase/shikimate dehydrogenase